MRYWLPIIMMAVLYGASKAEAITLAGFKEQAAAGELRPAMDAVIATNSPQFIVQAQRAIETEENSEQELQARQALMLAASGLKPRSHDEAKWVSRAQYDLAKLYLDSEIKLDKATSLLEQATDHGHPKAPERLAKLISETDVERAKTLLRLSISRGNTKAALMLADLDNDDRLRAVGLEQLRERARNGDVSAQTALGKYLKHKKKK